MAVTSYSWRAMEATNNKSAPQRCGDPELSVKPSGPIDPARKKQVSSAAETQRRISRPKSHTLSQSRQAK